MFIEPALLRLLPNEPDPFPEHAAHLKSVGVHTRVTGGEHCSETVFAMGQRKKATHTSAPRRYGYSAAGSP